MSEIILIAGLGYVCWRIYTILPFGKWVKAGLLAVFALAMLAFALAIFGKLDRLPMWLASATYIFGNSWLVFFLYLLMVFALMDILALMNILPAKLLRSSAAGSAIAFGIVIAALTYGGIHYRHKQRREMTIVSAKVEAPVKLVMLSDLHMGYHNRRAALARWVDMINAEKPDLVLFAGDIIDRSVRAITLDADSLEFQRLEAPVYACLGNHEYYAGVEDSEKFYREAHITLLKDSVATDCGITIIGRDDRKNEGRRKLVNILKDTRQSQFRLVLDHQPEDLLEASLSGVDFQFSGHTHNGQVWPVSWIETLKFEVPHGPHAKGTTQYYISSGMGIWGGRFRIGTDSEYLVLNIVPARQQVVQ